MFAPWPLGDMTQYATAASAVFADSDQRADQEGVARHQGEAKVHRTPPR
jgi:hypothetical protein